LTIKEFLERLDLNKYVYRGESESGDGDSSSGLNDSSDDGSDTGEKDPILGSSSK
jgi:hypothetical protein